MYMGRKRRMGGEMVSIRNLTVLTGLLAAIVAMPRPAAAQDLTAADADFANRIFAGAVPKPKAYACFVRTYDAEHLAQHPLQKVSVMKLLISAEKTDPKEDKVLEYSFRLGVNFRDRPGNFDSSGECGHAPTVRNPDTDPTVSTGSDFECDVDSDGGGVTVNLANNDGAVIVKLPERIRIWKGKDPDESAMSALMAGADDKIFRLDRADPNQCAALAYDRKELAALRHK
jgi:hypothetical protein